jgi:maleate isomerase
MLQRCERSPVAQGFHGDSARRALGRIPRHAALDMGRQLKREHPAADSLLLPSPHWPTAGAIEQLERELGINVMTAQQAIVWDALRRCGVNDPIPGFGRLLREF